jgi:redox-sensitive bicupin YhaK (pirin superfamily)
MNSEKHSFHKAGDRMFSDHGWLKSYHTFSFGSYSADAPVNFGALRVLNDDTVAAGMGFGRHPHDNMEIISIPTFGDLKHGDSMGNGTVIKQGDIQVMSAGTGIAHSESNANNDKEVRFFQIWLYPNQRNVQPRYDQFTIDESKTHNNLLQILSPDKNDDGVWIHQDAWFSLGNLDTGFTTQYHVKRAGNGVYAFIIEGEATVNGQQLQRRDGLGIEGNNTITIQANTSTKVLLIDVPMTF